MPQLNVNRRQQNII